MKEVYTRNMIVEWESEIFVAILFEKKNITCHCTSLLSNNILSCERDLLVVFNFLLSRFLTFVVLEFHHVNLQFFLSRSFSGQEFIVLVYL